LWDILFRGQLGFSISFLEEMWARNIGNLMMSPLKPIEFLLALMAMSLVRLAIGVIPMTLLALFLFHFNFYSLGLPLIAFFCNLIFTSWAVGIFVSGLVLRNGLTLRQGLRAVGPYDLLVGDEQSELLVPLHAIVRWSPAGSSS